MKTLLVVVVLWAAGPDGFEWKEARKNYATEAECITARDKLIESQTGKRFGVVARCTEPGAAK